MTINSGQAGFDWQRGIWDQMSAVYCEEIDTRFAPVVEHLFSLCPPAEYQSVLDLGAGTGAVAVAAAKLFGADCAVTAVDISAKMLERARERIDALGLANIDCLEGSAERIPVEDTSQDLILSSLCLMFALDRAAAAREIKRTLKPGGRFIATVWGSREVADIVRFQEIAGSFAPKPPIAGAGPGALGNPESFVGQLEDQGLTVTVEAVNTEFTFDSFDAAWNTLIGVTARGMDPEVLGAAQTALRSEMWPGGDGARTFVNSTQYIVATA